MGFHCALSSSHLGFSHFRQILGFVAKVSKTSQNFGWPDSVQACLQALVSLSVLPPLHVVWQSDSLKPTTISGCQEQFPQLFGGRARASTSASVGQQQVKEPTPSDEARSIQPGDSTSGQSRSRPTAANGREKGLAAEVVAAGTHGDAAGAGRSHAVDSREIAELQEYGIAFASSASAHGFASNDVSVEEQAELAEYGIGGPVEDEPGGEIGGTTNEQNHGQVGKRRKLEAPLESNFGRK